MGEIIEVAGKNDTQYVKMEHNFTGGQLLASKRIVRGTVHKFCSYRLASAGAQSGNKEAVKCMFDVCTE